MNRNYLLIIIFLLSCRKPDCTLLRKEGSWDMIITNITIHTASGESDSTIDRLYLVFLSKTHGEIRALNGKDTTIPFSWKYTKIREVLNPSLNEIQFNCLGVLYGNFEVTENKRNHEVWKSINSFSMNSYQYKTHVELKRR